MLSWAIYPALDANIPAGLSAAVVQGALRDQLGFQGIAITDALEAGALGAFGNAGARAVLAAPAGINLILLLGARRRPGAECHGGARRRARRRATRRHRVRGGGRARGRAAGQPAPSRIFPETGRTVVHPFLAYWARRGGLAIDGYPLSGEFTEVLEDGKPYTVQYFERVRLNPPENPPP